MANPPNNLFGTPASSGTGGGFSFGSATPGGTSGFSFGTTKPATAAASNTSGLGTGGFSFGGGGTTLGGTSGGLSFGSGTPSTTATAAPAGGGGFSFAGAQPAAASTTNAASAGGFSLGAGVKPVGSNFSFGATPAASTAAPTLGGAPANTGGFSLGTGATAATTAAAGGFSFGATPSATPAATLSLGGAPTLGGTPTLGGAPAATTTATSGFGFGGGSTLGGSTSGGFSLGGATPASSTSSGFSLGAGLGASKPVGFGTPVVSTTTPATVAAASATTNQGFSFGAKTATATTAVSALGSTTAPALGSGTLGTLGTLGTPSTTTSITGGGLPFGATATKPSEGLGSLLGKPATTSTTGPASAGLSLSLPTVASTATTTSSTLGLSLGGLGGLTASKAPTTTTTTTTAAPSTQGPTLSYHQLEQAINKWTVQLEDQEKIFLTQATQVNAWDRILIHNGEMITTLHSDLEKVKTDQQRLEHELDFIMAQQRELEDMLVPLEDAVRTQQQGTVYSQHADSERERTYVLAENIDGQMKRMVQDLREIIEHLNTANAPQDTNDPITQIGKILNAHMDSLQWIDQNTVMLQRKVDEVTKQSEIVRRDQEKNVHLAFD